MADKNLKVLISADDKTGAGIKSAEKNLSSLSSTALKLGGVLAGTFAVGKIISFGKESFEAFKSAEAAMARVNTTLAQMGEKGIKATDSILKMSQASIKLGFDDEDTAESIAKLFQRTGDLTKAQELNALAMDLSRAKNIDLSTATTLVGQVLAGNGKILKQYGIDIKDSATPLEALGDLHDKVKGQAVAFAETSAGKMEALKVSFGNLKETVGEFMNTAILPVIDALNVLFGALPSLDEIRARFSGFFDMLDEKTGIVTFLKNAWNDLVLVYTQSLKPAIDELWVALQPYMPFLQALAVVFGTALVIAITAFIKAVQMALVFIIEMITTGAKLSTWLLNTLGPAFSYVGDKIAGAYNWLVKMINKIQDLISMKGISGAVAKLFGARAIGGPVTANKPYLVGEKGPEVFTPQGYGTITPAGALGGGNMVINITGNSFMGKEGVAEEIGEGLMKLLKLNTRL